ncbi:MAG: hypothetical protein P9X24_05830 [Candidatus Hatepunaea meridiana]|nr:hypothetical protein [Candidatus Hatepunaea meridiana]
MKKLRIYLDTSVFGGCFDKEFADASRKLFEEIKAGRYILVLSLTNIEELKKAPEYVHQLIQDLPDESVEMITLTDEIKALRDAYIEAGVVGRASFFDAEHIASATVADVDLIVSWNFKHIVHFQKIRAIMQSIC